MSAHSFVSEQSRRIVRLIDIRDDIDDIRRKDDDAADVAEVTSERECPGDSSRP
jgi:hypothetical protein